jgi:hypothetical protein
MRFGQPTIPDRRTEVAVIVPSGRDIAAGAAVSSGLGVGQRLHRSTEQGWYRVRYRVVFIDGHLRSGVYRFRVSTAAASAADPQKWVWLLGSGWVLFLVYAVSRYRRFVPALSGPALGKAERPSRSR